MNYEEAKSRWIEQTREAQRALQRKRPIDDESFLASAWDRVVPRDGDHPIFNRPPLIHQLEAYHRFRDQPYFALFWQQRARKTGVVLNVFRHRVAHGDVDALIVIAYPNGVQHVWIDELAKDIPLEELREYRWLAWRSGKTTSGKAREEALSLRAHPGPIVIALNSHALNTPKGWRYLEWLLAKRRAMLVADEASWAANWSAATRKLLTLGGFYGSQRNVIVKAILDGTPVDEGPEDVYFPTSFLNKGILGFTSKESFRARYLVYEEEELEPGVRVRVKHHNHRTGSDYERVVGTQHMDELQAKLLTFGSRVLRREVSDAPAQTFQHRYFDLTEKQRRVYDKARDEYIAELSRGEVGLREVLLRMIRLQMIARNYYPAERYAEPCQSCDAIGCDSAGEVCSTCEGDGYIERTTSFERIDTRSPALEAMIEETRASRTPSVIWCAFKQDVADCLEILGPRAVRYDGSIPEQQRERAYQDFKIGRYDHIVGTITSGLSRGKDLSRAGLAVFYSNVFSRRARSQAQDRTEGLDLIESTGIVDLVATDTRDVDVVEALLRKRDLAAAIMGDPLHLL